MKPPNDPVMDRLNDKATKAKFRKFIASQIRPIGAEANASLEQSDQANINMGGAGNRKKQRPFQFAIAKAELRDWLESNVFSAVAGISKLSTAEIIATFSVIEVASADDANEQYDAVVAELTRTCTLLDRSIFLGTRTIEIWPRIDAGHPNTGAIESLIGPFWKRVRRGECADDGEVSSTSSFDIYSWETCPATKGVYISLLQPVLASAGVSTGRRVPELHDDELILGFAVSFHVHICGYLTRPALDELSLRASKVLSTAFRDTLMADRWEGDPETIDGLYGDALGDEEFRLALGVVSHLRWCLRCEFEGGHKRKGDLIRRFHNATKLLSAADQADEPLVKLPLIVGALEALLSRSTQNLSDQVARRVATLLKDDAKHRMSLIKQIRALYDVRSKCIHGEDVLVAAIDVFNARALAGQVTTTISSWCDFRHRLDGNAESFDDFFDALQKAEVEGSPFMKPTEAK